MKSTAHFVLYNVVIPIAAAIAGVLVTLVGYHIYQDHLAVHQIINAIVASQQQQSGTVAQSPQPEKK